MGERYLGAEYEAAQQNLDERKRTLDTAQQGYFDRASKTPIFDAIDYRLQKWLTGRAEKKLAKLKAGGGAEAMVIELNKEYERLKKNAEQSIKELKQFERSKLGVTDEDEIET
jgi:hypothetical protein